MSQFATELSCVNCQHRFAVTGGLWMTCDDCGAADGILDVHYDLELVRSAWQQQPLAGRAFNHWRYRELLPIEADSIPDDWQVGWTPQFDSPRLAKICDVRQIFVKDEGRNPTASYKDRASSVGVVHALQHRASTIACASTGNAATSLAGHAALAGIPAVIFVPQSAPQPKLAQLLVYGAKVVSVQGTYDEAYELCSAACDRFGWYNRNCAINPILVEGKKTGGLELAEQWQRAGGKVPDWVAVSVGDGCTIAGIWKGIKQMQALGVIEKTPRMLAVQAEGVAPIIAAVNDGQLPNTNWAGTFADSIDVAVPRNWRKAVSAIVESGGSGQTVSDDQILSAMRLAGGCGIFAEPAAAASVAGIIAARQVGTIQSSDSVVAMITGSGLKDTKSALRAGGSPITIPADLDALEQAMNDD